MAAEVSCRDIVLTSGNVRDNSRKEKTFPKQICSGSLYSISDRHCAVPHVRHLPYTAARILAHLRFFICRAVKHRAHSCDSLRISLPDLIFAHTGNSHKNLRVAVDHLTVFNGLAGHMELGQGRFSRRAGTVLAETPAPARRWILPSAA